MSGKKQTSQISIATPPTEPNHLVRKQELDLVGGIIDLGASQGISLYNKMKPYLTESNKVYRFLYNPSAYGVGTTGLPAGIESMQICHVEVWHRGAGGHARLTIPMAGGSVNDDRAWLRSYGSSGFAGAWVETATQNWVASNTVGRALILPGAFTDIIDCINANRGNEVVLYNATGWANMPTGWPTTAWGGLLKVEGFSGSNYRKVTLTMTGASPRTWIMLGNDSGGWSTGWIEELTERSGVRIGGTLVAASGDTLFDKVIAVARSTEYYCSTANNFTDLPSGINQYLSIKIYKQGGASTMLVEIAEYGGSRRIFRRTINAAGVAWENSWLQIITGGQLAYSTTEVNTGKVWEDGKPIYRRVIKGTIPAITSSSQVGNVGTISGMETLVSMTFMYRESSNGVANSGNGARCVSPFEYTIASGAQAGTYGINHWITSTGTISWQVKGTLATLQWYLSNAPVTITVEYTKT